MRTYTTLNKRDSSGGISHTWKRKPACSQKCISLKRDKLLMGLWEFWCLSLTAWFNSCSWGLSVYGLWHSFLTPSQSECKTDICFNCGLHRQIPGYISLYTEGSCFHLLVGNSAGMVMSQYDMGGLGPWLLQMKCRVGMDSQESNPSIRWQFCSEVQYRFGRLHSF